MNHPPQAVISYYPPDPKLREAIIFNGSLSQDEDGDKLTYNWKMGDGTPKEGDVVEHSYQRVITYTVSLVVTDDRGGRGEASRSIIVGLTSIPKNMTIIATGGIYTTDGLGNLSLLKSNNGWETTFDLIVPGNFNSDEITDLLFYNATNGKGEFYSTDGTGNINLMKESSGWSKTLKAIVPGNFNGDVITDLFVL